MKKVGLSFENYNIEYGDVIVKAHECSNLIKRKINLKSYKTINFEGVLEKYNLFLLSIYIWDILDIENGKSRGAGPVPWWKCTRAG